MSTNRILTILILVLALAAISFACVLGVQSIGAWLTVADPLVTGGLLAGLVIVLAARILAAGLEARSAVTLVRDGRFEIYQQILTGCLEGKSQDAAVARLILLARPQTLTRYQEFQAEPSPERFERLCQAMRSDLGQGNFGIKTGVIVALVSHPAPKEDGGPLSVRQWILSPHDRA